MGTGIRAEVKIDAAGACPITRTAEAAGGNTFSISKSVDPGDPERVTEEFMLDVGESSQPPDPGEELTEVFAYGSQSVYRFSRERGRGCPCECVEQFDCPVVDVHTRRGALYLVFHASDMEQLRDVISSLRESYPDVDIRRLLRSQGERADHDLVFLDRGSLTGRQREVLETAHRMGYFDHPKGANAGEVADELDINPSTFTEHLAAAQTKLMSALLDA